MRLGFRLTAAFAVLALSVPAFATLSPQWSDWAQGPAQWLMTKDEQKAWKTISDDQAATEFVALFWARRDPTVNTPANEFRDEFDRRVAYADANFKSAAKRGALTDPGRVYIVIGPPERVGTIPPAHGEAGHFGKIMAFDYGKHPQMYGLTNIVYFPENLFSHEFDLDFQRANVSGALSQGVDKAIVNKKLTAVPDWARSVQPTAPATQSP